ncbi:TPA: hypothetical protein ACH3X2_009260 [Trebouxia sp. C0005]
MPGPSDALSKPKASTSNVYAQKVVVKQAGRSHMADPLQDMQKQRLLQPDSPRKSDSPTSHVPHRANQLQPLVNYSPRQVQMPQQPHTEPQLQQLPQQADQSDQWHWQHQTPSPRQPQAFEVMLQQPTGNQLAQNGTANGQQSAARPHSASFAESLGSDSQPQPQSASQAPEASPRPRTATASASPRSTMEQQAFAVIRSKNVSWQDAQGQNLCQYREFEPSEAGDSDNDDTDWHTQKKGCCIIM